jgi:hypothetical protein
MGMGGVVGFVPIQGTADLSRIEAPVTFKAYLLCAFAAFGGVCKLPRRPPLQAHTNNSSRQSLATTRDG